MVTMVIKLSSLYLIHSIEKCLLVVSMGIKRTKALLFYKEQIYSLNKNTCSNGQDREPDLIDFIWWAPRA